MMVTTQTIKLKLGLFESNEIIRALNEKLNDLIEQFGEAPILRDWKLLSSKFQKSLLKVGNFKETIINKSEMNYILKVCREYSDKQFNGYIKALEFYF